VLAISGISPRFLAGAGLFNYTVLPGKRLHRQPDMLVLSRRIGHDMSGRIVSRSHP